MAALLVVIRLLARLGLLLLLDALLGSLGYDLAPAQRIPTRTRARSRASATKHELAAGPAAVVIRDLLAGLVELGVADAPAAALPIGLGDLALDFVTQVPELAVVVAVHVVGELVAQGVADGLVVAVAVVRVGAQAQLDDGAPVAVQPQDARGALVAGLRVRQRVHLRQQPHAELVRAHRRPDPRVGLQPLEEGERTRRVRQVRQRAQRRERVRAVFARAPRVPRRGVRFRQVAPRGGQVRLSRRRVLRGRGQRGDLGARRADQSDLLVLQVGHGVVGEGGALEHAELGHHELLVVGGDEERSLDLGG